MRLKPEQLANHTTKSLLPLYWISGDEILLVQEACDLIRQAARQHSFSEREVYHVDNHLDWGQVYESVQSGSLFAERKLIELHLPANKMPDAFTKFLQEYATRSSEDNLLLIRSGRLDKKALNTKWAKAVDEIGAIIQIWPVELSQLPRWIEQRLQQRGFLIDHDALLLLAERVEGNLLAAHQEVEKLRILSNESRLSLEEINRCVVDSARYNLFDLVDECLHGNTAHSLKILNGLHAEGVEPVLILWALAREVRHLDGLFSKLAQGQSVETLLNHPSIPKKRTPALRRALRNLSSSALVEIGQLLQRSDHAVKGGPGDAWTLLRTACIRLGGTAIPY